MAFQEVLAGKGLSGALKLAGERGLLDKGKELDERNIDTYEERFKNIEINRKDEFGRDLTEHESFRLFSHRFHGKGPGKRKQEKLMKKYQQELKLKQNQISDAPLLSVERMKEVQAWSKTPYVLLSGNVKTSDPSRTEKDFSVSGDLTPMLGDTKRKTQPKNTSLTKKSRT